MICTKCQTRNPIGNKFCRECGDKLALPEGDALAQEEAERAERERRQEKVAALLADAFRFSEKNQVDEALPLATEAAELIPESTSAHALLASLYERSEQNDRAIAAMERVVALNPDSVADREKLELLRRGVHVLPIHNERPRQKQAIPTWFPLAAGGAAFALILGTGMSLIQNRLRGNPPSASPRTPQTAVAPRTVDPTGGPNLLAGTGATSATGRFDPFATPTTTPVATPMANGDAAPSTQSNLPSVARTTTAPPRTATPPKLPSMPAPSNGSLAGVPPPGRFRLPSRPNPNLTSSSASGSGGNGALPPIGPIGAVPPPATGSTGASVGGGGGSIERIPAKPPIHSGTASGGSSESYIRISVSAPPRPSSNPSPSPTAPPPAPIEVDPLARAQSLQAQGRYAEAASAYGQAARARSGISAGDAFQGMALCHQRLGDLGAARSAYRQAISAYQSGGGDTGAAKRGIATCRAALEVLGDG